MTGPRPSTATPPPIAKPGRRKRYFGLNPYMISSSTRTPTALRDPVVQEPPPALPKIELSNFTHVKSLGSSQRATTAIVDYVGLGRVILKAYPPYTGIPTTLGGRDLDPFVNESAAYARLVHFGVSSSKGVPFCYGWADLHQGCLQELKLHREPDPDAACGDQFEASVTGEEEYPRRESWVALILEYIPAATPIDFKNINEDLAQEALKLLCRVHDAGVLHNDIGSRNVLVTQRDASPHMVLIDFDVAVSAPHRTFGELECNWEMGLLWSLMYDGLLFDKKQGYKSFYG